MLHSPSDILGSTQLLNERGTWLRLEMKFQRYASMA